MAARWGLRKRPSAAPQGRRPLPRAAGRVLTAGRLHRFNGATEALTRALLAPLPQILEPAHDRLDEQLWPPVRRPRPHASLMARPFARVLIANRGEIAVRVARTLREMGISPIAVYSDADRASLHVRHADRAVAIGPAPASESYLRIDAIVDAAVQTGADAIHPGYGFLSERAELVEACEARGIAFIGPSAAAMRVMGTKTSARAAMEACGVPCVPGSRGACASAEDACAEPAKMGYPVMLKAAAGGGGKGMRLVQEACDLPAAWRMASSEAQSAFGDASVYMEKALLRPRHIEVQIFANAHGDVWALGERDCSMQRGIKKEDDDYPS